jgi:hypothetical protein
MELCGIGMRAEDGQAQITWQHARGKESAEPHPADIETTISKSALEYLREQRGEPSPYLYLHTAGLVGLAAHPAEDSTPSPSDYLSQVHSTYQHALSFRNGFLRYEGSDKSIEVGQWWVQESGDGIRPLADRIEMTLVNCLLKNPGFTFSEIDKAICQVFPGLTPPEVEMMQVCLDSYGVQDPPGSGRWFIQEWDFPIKRRADILEITSLLLELGNRLGFETFQDHKSLPTIQWENRIARLSYSFYLSASAVIGKYLTTSQSSANKSLIVIPGSRSNLVAYKLKCNTHLSHIVNQGWRFIKYRHIRQLVDSSTLNINNLDEQLSLDPLTYTKPQMRLL